MPSDDKLVEHKCIREYEFDWNLKNVQAKECPVLSMDDSINTLFKCFNDYEFRHILPYGGGGMSQPCLLMNGIDIVGKVWQDHQADRRAESRG